MAVNCNQEMADLLAQRASLMRRIASGIAEVEQPALGRTQYQPVADMQAALRLLDDQIAVLASICGIENPTLTSRNRRHAFYPFP